MLNWAKQFNIFCFLDNQQYNIHPHNYECLLAAGVKTFVETGDLQKVDSYLKSNDQWIFGHVSYDIKDELHFPSGKTNKIGFPKLYFFIPQVVLLIKNNELIIVSDDPDEIYGTVLQQTSVITGITRSISMQQSLTKEAYLQKIDDLRAHILRGDCYEINFCQEFFAEEAGIDPFAVFQKLLDISPNPFSAFYRLDDKFLLCASPERFLCKKDNRLLSQPIKGTIKRDVTNQWKDERLKTTLQNSKKDRAENVMVVDLVRNDLSKICKKETVKVDELFGIYSFPQVHQMISTISGELKNDIPFSEILKALFPMGSMTGAPKHRVMQLIDEYEPQSRGIFSGAVGYFSPGGNFDFNVVIRSVMYNATSGYLSWQVGSGITFYSDAEQEWEECLLKAEAIKQALSVNADK